MEEAGIGNLKSSGNYLIQLEANGFLKSEIIRKEKLYLNARLMKILKSHSFNSGIKDRLIFRPKLLTIFYKTEKIYCHGNVYPKTNLSEY